MHAFRGDLAVPHDCVVGHLVLTLKECRNVYCDVVGSEDIPNVNGHDGIASITVTLQTTAFYNLSVTGRLTPPPK